MLMQDELGTHGELPSVHAKQSHLLWYVLRGGRQRLALCHSAARQVLGGVQHAGACVARLADAVCSRVAGCGGLVVHLCQQGHSKSEDVKPGMHCTCRRCQGSYSRIMVNTQPALHGRRDRRIVRLTVSLAAAAARFACSAAARPASLSFCAASLACAEMGLSKLARDRLLTARVPLSCGPAASSAAALKSTNPNPFPHPGLVHMASVAILHDLSLLHPQARRARIDELTFCLPVHVLRRRPSRSPLPS